MIALSVAQSQLILWTLIAASVLGYVMWRGGEPKQCGEEFLALEAGFTYREFTCNEAAGHDGPHRYTDQHFYWEEAA